MASRLLVLLFVLAALAGCTKRKDEPPPIGPDVEGVIFDAEQGQGFAHRDGEKAFRATEADVRRAEAALPKFLAQPLEQALQTRWPREAERRQKVLAKLPSYKRQWAGLATENKRVLYMNFFCRVHELQQWRTAPVSSCDGGDCYFHVDYDLDTGAFDNLSINGEG